jgi:hypothetical protein
MADATEIVDALTALDDEAAKLESTLIEISQQASRLAEEYAALVEDGADVADAPFPSQFTSEALQEFND